MGRPIGLIRPGGHAGAVLAFAPMNGQPEEVWRQVDTRGFAVVPQLLSPEEVDLVRRDFESVEPVHPRLNQTDPDDETMYTVSHVSPAVLDALAPRLRSLGRRRDGVRPSIELVVAAFYWDTRAASFPIYHQDLDPYWLFQDPTHYWNIYIPVIKPDPARSNLDVLPCDALARVAPELVDRGRGPYELAAHGSAWKVRNLSDGSERVVDLDLGALREGPPLAAGAALSLRGDALHRTQDTETVRVAASIRMIDPEVRLSWARLVAGGEPKLRAIAANWRLLKACSCFLREGKRELTGAEVYRFVSDGRPPDEHAERMIHEVIAGQGASHG